MNYHTLRQTASALALLLLSGQSVTAQPLPQDKNVRQGRLSNGLTYYIRHNDREPHLADFYIAQRVGSILEEPRQRGLAHFLEHMAFNGTEHFRGTDDSPGVVSACERMGIKFGTNLNAYTSVDQTVYNISAAPVNREGVIDTCLLILHDWSHSLLLTDKEIDKERGVIHEEWRTRRSGMAVQRMMEEVIPQIYRGTKYEDCLPIGHMDVVDNFSYDALRDYYHKWYRPDLQAIVVVGDVDVEQMEARIKRLFGGIAAAEQPAERIYYPVPDNDTLIVATAKDAEQPFALATLYMKRDATDRTQKNTLAYQRDGYLSRLILQMLNARLLEAQRQPDAPFIHATAKDGAFFVSQTKDAFALSVGAKRDSVTIALSAAIAEVERVRQHGFTATELVRAKKVLLHAAERQLREADKRQNKFYVSQMVQHFLWGEPLLSAQEAWRVAKQLDAEVKMSDVKKAVQEIMTDRNQVLTLYSPQREDWPIPSVKTLQQTVLQAQTAQYAPYEDRVVATQLMDRAPKGGKVVSQKAGRWGTTVLTLSNGVTVTVKPTTNQADAVSLQYFGMGGTSRLPEADAAAFHLVGGAITEGGAGRFSATDLRKVLAGHSLRLMPQITNETQGFKGSASASDLRQLLQLLYLYITQPHRDDRAFASLIQRQQAVLSNRTASAKVVYNDSINRAAYGLSPRTAPLTAAALEGVRYDRILELWKQLFGNARGHHLLLVGNVTVDSLRPLLEQYVATLPTQKRALETDATAFPAVQGGERVLRFRHPQSTPTARVTVLWSMDAPVTTATDLQLDVLGRVLQMMYTDSLREEKGGTYGVSVRPALDKLTRPTSFVRVSFTCDPKRYEELQPVVYEQLRLLAKEGPTEERLNKVKMYLEKTYKQSQVDNGYWLYVLYNDAYQQLDFDTDYLKELQALTADDVKQLAARLLASKRSIEVTMLPE